MSFVVPSIFKAVDQITKPLRVMKNGVKSFADFTVNAMHRVDRAAIGFGRTINTLTGGFGILLGTAGAFQVLGGAINIIADYEQANANLAAVTQVSAKEMEKLKESSFNLGASTKFTAAEVAGLQTELGKLGFTVPEILDSTGAVLSLASATQTDLAQTATQVGAALRAFQLDASEAGRVADVFAASTAQSALDMTKLDVALSQVAPVANQFGFSIENTVALMGKLADAGFEASTIATSTRSIILNLADSNGKLAKALGGPAKTLPDVTAAMVKLRDSGIDLAGMLNLTDKRSVAAFANFLEGAESINKLSFSLENAGGTAEKMANIQLDTLQGRLTILNSAYQGFILQQDKSNTGFLASIKVIIEVATEMLALGAGTAKATEELNSHQKSIRTAANVMISLVKVISVGIAFYAAAKVGLLLYTIATKGYTLALKIQSIWQARNILGFKALLFTLKIATGVVKIFTVVTRGLGIALRFLALNPIGIALTVMVGIIVLLIQYWNEWGAAVSVLLGPLGLAASLIQSFRRNWELVKQAFEVGGIVNGFKAIGLTIIDAVLQPLEEVLKLIKNLTGFDQGLKELQAARLVLQRNLEIMAVPEPVNIAPGGPNIQTRQFEPLNPTLLQAQANDNSDLLAELQLIRQELANRPDVNVNVQNQDGEIIESPDTDIPINTARGFAF